MRPLTPLRYMAQAGCHHRRGEFSRSQALWENSLYRVLVEEGCEVQTVGQRVDRGGHVAYKARQTLRRTILGNMLRRAREAADVEVKTVVQATGMSQPVVYRQEDGIAPVPVEKIPALAELYEVTDPETIAKWTKWAEISATKGPGGPTATASALVRGLRRRGVLAREIRAFEPVVIHGLLQTKAYSEEAIRASDTAITGPRPLPRRCRD